MTNYDLANTVLSLLIIQGRQSLKEDGRTCQYRGANGCKCGAGLVLDDQYYREELDKGKLVVGDMPVDSALQRSGFTQQQLPLLHSLQRMHDYYDSREQIMDFRKYIQKIQGRFWQATKSDKSDEFVSKWFEGSEYFTDQ